MKNKFFKINPTLIGLLIAIYVGIDFFLHILFPMAGYPFLEWNSEVAYGLFIPFSGYFERLSGIGLLAATLTGLIWGFVSGYLLGLVYNIIITQLNKIKLFKIRSDRK